MLSLKLCGILSAVLTWPGTNTTSCFSLSFPSTCLFSRPLFFLLPLSLPSPSLQAMDWCLENGSANLLSHLRSLGHPVPPHLFTKYTDVLSQYFFTQHQPTPVPQFTKNDLSIAPETSNFEDTLDEPEEPLQVVDTRPTILVSPTFHLPWGSLSLTVFLSEFLRSRSLSGLILSHIDLSRNRLSEIPLEIFFLPCLKFLNVSHNGLTSLPALEGWAHHSRLQILNASHNSLGGGGSPLPQRRGGGDAAVSVPCAGEVWSVDLSHNDFCGFPSWVTRFPSLRVLNLSGNPQVLYACMYNFILSYTSQEEDEENCSHCCPIHL